MERDVAFPPGRPFEKASDAANGPIVLSNHLHHRPKKNTDINAKTGMRIGMANFQM